MKKYLQYALGEILLVVVGILIALSINNWNNASAKSEKIDKVVLQVISDLRSDTTTANNTLKYYEPIDSIFKKVILDSISLEEYSSCYQCHGLITIMQPFTPNTGGYNLLKNFETNLQTPRDSLMMETKKFYAQQLPILELLNEMIKDDISSNLMEWRDTKEWYKDFIIGKNNPEIYNYMKNDPIYKNKVANFYILLYGNFLSGLKIYSMQAADLAEKWEKNLNG